MEEMNKREFNKILKEATSEFEEEKKERMKSFLKERMKEYEMAKTTVKRIEKQFTKIQEEGLEHESLFIDCDN